MSIYNILHFATVIVLRKTHNDIESSQASKSKTNNNSNSNSKDNNDFSGSKKKLPKLTRPKSKVKSKKKTKTNSNTNKTRNKSKSKTKSKSKSKDNSSSNSKNNNANSGTRKRQGILKSKNGNNNINHNKLSKKVSWQWINEKTGQPIELSDDALRSLLPEQQIERFGAVFVQYGYKWVSGDLFGGSNDPNALPGSFSQRNNGYLVPENVWTTNYSFSSIDLTARDETTGLSCQKRRKLSNGGSKGGEWSVQRRKAAEREAFQQQQQQQQQQAQQQQPKVPHRRVLRRAKPNYIDDDDDSSTESEANHQRTLNSDKCEIDSANENNNNTDNNVNANDAGHEYEYEYEDEDEDEDEDEETDIDINTNGTLNINNDNDSSVSDVDSFGFNHPRNFLGNEADFNPSRKSKKNVKRQHSQQQRMTNNANTTHRLQKGTFGEIARQQNRERGFYNKGLPMAPVHHPDSRSKRKYDSEYLPPNENSNDNYEDNLKNNSNSNVSTKKRKKGINHSNTSNTKSKNKQREAQLVSRTANKNVARAAKNSFSARKGSKKGKKTKGNKTPKTKTRKGTSTNNNNNSNDNSGSDSHTFQQLYKIAKCEVSNCNQKDHVNTRATNQKKWMNFNLKYNHESTCKSIPICVRAVRTNYLFRETFLLNKIDWDCIPSPLWMQSVGQGPVTISVIKFDNRSSGTSFGDNVFFTDNDREKYSALDPANIGKSQMSIKDLTAHLSVLMELIYRKSKDKNIVSFINHAQRHGVCSDAYYYQRVVQQLNNKDIEYDEQNRKVCKELFKHFDMCIANQIAHNKKYVNDINSKLYDASSDPLILVDLKTPDIVVGCCQGLKYCGRKPQDDPHGIKIAQFYGLRKLSKYINLNIITVFFSVLFFNVKCFVVCNISCCQPIRDYCASKGYGNDDGSLFEGSLRSFFMQNRQNGISKETIDKYRLRDDPCVLYGYSPEWLDSLPDCNETSCNVKEEILKLGLWNTFFIDGTPESWTLTPNYSKLLAGKPLQDPKFQDKLTPIHDSIYGTWVPDPQINYVTTTLTDEEKYPNQANIDGVFGDKPLFDSQLLWDKESNDSSNKQMNVNKHCNVSNQLADLHDRHLRSESNCNMNDYNSNSNYDGYYNNNTIDHSTAMQESETGVQGHEFMTYPDLTDETTNDQGYDDCDYDNDYSKANYSEYGYEQNVQTQQNQRNHNYNQQNTVSWQSNNGNKRHFQYHNNDNNDRPPHLQVNDIDKQSNINVKHSSCEPTTSELEKLVSFSCFRDDFMNSQPGASNGFVQAIGKFKWGFKKMAGRKKKSNK